MTVATRLEASVVMLSRHRPVPTISATHAAAVAATRGPPVSAPRATTTAPTSHQGEPVSSASKGLSSRVVTTSRTAPVTPAKPPCAHAVAESAVRAIAAPTPEPAGNCAAHT